MNIKKTLLLFGTVVALMIAMWLLLPIQPPVIQTSLMLDETHTIQVAAPLWGVKGVSVVFVDTQSVDINALGKRITSLGLTLAIVDSKTYLQAYTVDNEQCLDNEVIESLLSSVLSKLPHPANSPVIIAGVKDGALIPFINALSASASHITNLSIGFSVNLPLDLNVCPPLVIAHKDNLQTLTSSSSLDENWRAVWTDQPDDATSVFIRSLGNVDTRIAPYDTQLEDVLVQEFNTALGQVDQAVAPMPVVEVPTAKASDTVTLFYSGDGGWRDLDRTVAGEMAAQNYPVVGVDVLRYFWEHKTPEQAASDLSATMAFYRQHWGVKSFVLAGYSFGADILPPIYNRLPPADQDSISLLVLLALADHADFEIHVSGWLGQTGGESALAPELAKMPKQKILCVYGVEEKAETACMRLANSQASLLELPGGHHFDQDYPKLTGQILDVYRQHGIH